jgi:phosphatidylglycerophosphate synthase
VEGTGVDLPRGGRSERLRYLLGLKRSGLEPAETRAGQPLRPLTLPNLVSYLRVVLLAVFLAIALSSGDGRVTAATICFSIAAGGDYLDGLLARLTGQYSRLGTLMDPFVDRAVIVAGAAVAWKFELLPRWALAALAVRELVMLVLVGLGMQRGLDIKINWIGRIAVWPAMGAVGLTLIADVWLAEALLYAGLAGVLAASAIYVRDGLQELRTG